MLCCSKAHVAGVDRAVRLSQDRPPPQEVRVCFYRGAEVLEALVANRARIPRCWMQRDERYGGDLESSHGGMTSFAFFASFASRAATKMPAPVTWAGLVHHQARACERAI